MDAVVRELERDPQVRAAHIGVSAYDGAIALTGQVVAYPEKLAAVRAAERVNGVRAIADEIQVNLPGSSHEDDTAIAEHISRQMHWNVVVPDTVTAEVHHGHVTLRGTVQSNYQQHAVEGPIELVRGVCSVTNLITTEPSGTLIAGEIGRRVDDALANLADLRSVRVSTHNGSVRLEGHVRTLAERRVAERTAGSIPGVDRLRNDIVISP
jgi:osmotically-inducible protein OsmY